MNALDGTSCDNSWTIGQVVKLSEKLSGTVVKLSVTLSGKVVKLS